MTKGNTVIIVMLYIQKWVPIRNMYTLLPGGMLKFQHLVILYDNLVMVIYFE